MALQPRPVDSTHSAHNAAAAVNGRCRRITRVAAQAQPVNAVGQQRRGGAAVPQGVAKSRVGAGKWAVVDIPGQPIDGLIVYHVRGVRGVFGDSLGSVGQQFVGFVKFGLCAPQPYPRPPVAPA